MERKEAMVLVGQSRRAKRVERPLPSGTFDVIYADPPWEYANQIMGHGPASGHYDTMPMSNLLALTVPAASNATLFLWVTNPLLQEGLTLMEAWGFTYKTNLVWVKRNLQRPGLGWYVRGRHELLFIGTRGQHVPDQRGKAPLSSVLEAGVQEHSRKPLAAYELIESMYPEARRLELFARGPRRAGWEAWGNELEEAS
jgi:N6-adenosine-specific RNA methylase IME4